MPAKECRAFLEQWPDIAFRDPEAGRAHAAEGLARVEALGNPLELHARALAFSGSSVRPCDAFGALVFLERALSIYRDYGVSVTPSRQLLLDEADTRRRTALVHRDLAALGHNGHGERAFDEIDRAYKLYVALRDPQGVARCQLACATIHLRFDEYAHALRVLLPALPRLEGIYSIAAAHNVRTALLWSRRRGIPIPQDLRRLALSRNIRLVRLTPSSRERWVDRPTTGSFGRRKQTPEDALWRWNLGIFLLEDRRYRDALRVFLTARDDLAALGMPLYAAEIVLDVAPLYARFGMWQKVQQVAAEAAQLLADFPGSAQAVAAYGLWARAIEAEDHERLNEITAACHSALTRLGSVTR